MKGLLKVLVPLLLLAAGGLFVAYAVLNKPAPEKLVPEVVLPLVRVQPVVLEDVRLTVTSQGTVSPRTETRLVPEITGRVIEVAPSFAAGGFFDAGEVLLRIDPIDYRKAVVEARAAVARAELRLEQERAEAELALREWSELGRGETPPPLTRREPQLAVARASLEAARASIELAERNLDRTSIRAPYAGRVRRKLVDLGTYVTPGGVLATIYAVDYAEVRLPLPDEELAFLELPLDYRGGGGSGSGPRVILRARFAGEVHEWDGRIVRTEGEIDPESRLVHAVARIRDPYGRAEPRRPPLAVGMFVEAEIEGRRIDDVAVLPRSALREGSRMLVVDEEERLRFRPVEILRTTASEALVRGGLAPGERVCLSPLAVVADGMRVRIADGDGGEQPKPEQAGRG